MRRIKAEINIGGVQAKPWLFKFQGSLRWGLSEAGMETWPQENKHWSGKKGTHIEMNSKQMIRIVK
mgnify:CR=1 FL=1